MNLRSFQPGDELAQVSLFNGAACIYPGFKPAKIEDVQKRTRARSFDPATRVYAVEGGEVVGYCVLEPEQGRISFPWCKRGHTAAAAPLFEAMLNLARERGLTSLFAAYRRDWNTVFEFLESQGFAKTRDMVNYAVDVLDLPTVAVGTTSQLTPLRPEDLPFLSEMGRGVIRLPLEKLEKYFFANLYFPAECVNVLRSKDDGSPLAVNIAIETASFADVRLIDPLAPCFRLGAFGTEGLNVKRVNGMFSFLVRKPETALSHGLTLLCEAVESMTEDTVNAVAAQAPSDAPHLIGFYQRYFKEQGRFPVYERTL
jgi:hypothetical protein